VTLGNIKRKLKLFAPSTGPTTPKKGSVPPRATPSASASASGGSTGCAKKRGSADTETPSKRQKKKTGGAKSEKGEEEELGFMDGLTRYAAMKEETLDE